MQDTRNVGETHPSERRRSHREPANTLGQIRALDDDPFVQPQQVLVTNVSLHGVGFRSPLRLRDEVPYVIEIGVGPLHLSGRVKLVRVRVLPDGTWDIGAEFC